MDQDDVRLGGQPDDNAKSADSNDVPARDVPADNRPTGIGSEAAEGIHDMGVHVEGERSGLDGQSTGVSFRAGAERSGSEPLDTGGWVHESGYGGKGGGPRISSDQREDSEREGLTSSDADVSNAHVDARQSPFYEWLNNAAIRDLVVQSRELAPGEILVLIKGLVPGLVAAIGAARFHAFLAEIAVKGHRFQEAVDHPGEGRRTRTTPGELIGGPTPEGHEHLAIARNPDHRGAREAERDIEGKLWARTEQTVRSEEV